MNRRSALIVSFLLIAGIFAGLSFAPRASAATATYYPNQDTYTRSTSPTTNYGTNALLISEYTTTIYKTFIKDLYHDVGGTPSAITLYLYRNVAGVSTNLLIYNPTSAWDESTLTYNTMPTLSSLVASVSITGTVGWKAISIPTSQYTNSNFQNYGICISKNTTYPEIAYFRSSDTAESEKPYIVYTYTPGPTLTTNAAASITTSGATLNGNLDSLNGAAYANCYFQYGLTTSYGYTTSPATNKTTTGTFSKAVSGLTGGTTYHFRAVGAGNLGTGYGSDATFTTLTTAPSLTTSAATSITETTARLNGLLSSLGTASSVGCKFEWGLTTAYGNTTSTQTKTSTGSFYADISGLTLGQTYHFRTVGIGNGINGTSYGADQTFTTTILPDITTTAATGVNETAATLNGNLMDIKEEAYVNCYFEYGYDTSYGNTTTPATNKTANGTFSKAISGLSKGQTYHFRAIGVCANGTSYGTDLTFTTQTTIYLYYEYNMTLVPEELANGTEIEIEYDSHNTQHITMDTNPYTFSPTESSIYRIAAYWGDISRVVADTGTETMILAYVPSNNDTVLEYQFLVIDNINLNPETTLLEIYIYDINGTIQTIHRDWLSAEKTVSCFMIANRQYRLRIIDTVAGETYERGVIVADSTQQKYIILNEYPDIEAYDPTKDIHFSTIQEGIYLNMTLTSDILSLDSITITLLELRPVNNLIVLPIYEYSNEYSVSLSFTLNASKRYMINVLIVDSTYGTLNIPSDIILPSKDTSKVDEFNEGVESIINISNISSVGVAILSLVFLMAFGKRNAGIAMIITGFVYLLLSIGMGLSPASKATSGILMVLGFIIEATQPRRDDI